MGDFKQLRVWQKAEDLLASVYGATSTFPSNEQYGLTSQMRRAASSISANICEGSARQGDRDFARFLRIALGSATELEGHAISAKRVAYLSESDWRKINEATQDVRRMLISLIKYLNRPK
jgi:four helix bundle protein